MNEHFFKTKKLVNIILNCRERIDLTRKLIESIETKTKNLNLINLTILIDFDDEELINFFTKYLYLSLPTYPLVYYNGRTIF